MRCQVEGSASKFRLTVPHGYGWTWRFVSKTPCRGRRALCLPVLPVIRGAVKPRPSGRGYKSVHDAGWAAFFRKLSYKAESAGRRFSSVDARGTSQRCPCGEANPKRLSDREHVCLHCGLLTTRDHASAMEVLRLGLSLQPLTAVQLLLGRKR
jgi:hypothetical protein